MGGGGMGGGGINEPGTPPPAQGTQPNENTGHAALQLGPPGRWWDDKSLAKSVKLRPDQQIRMDAIFEQNRDSLVSRHQNLEQAESQMAEITRSPNPDEAALFTQIDRVAQANAELDKAYTHMLLQIRKEMDADQIARLEKHR